MAEEVRSLADESAKAVQGITSLIQTMQDNVNIVVKQMNEQVAFAVKESAKVSETTRLVESMSTNVHGMADAVVEISGLVEKQMTNIRNNCTSITRSGGNRRTNIRGSSRSAQFNRRTSLCNRSN